MPRKFRTSLAVICKVITAFTGHSSPLIVCVGTIRSQGLLSCCVVVAETGTFICISAYIIWELSQSGSDLCLDVENRLVLWGVGLSSYLLQNPGIIEMPILFYGGSYEILVEKVRLMT